VSEQLPTELWVLTYLQDWDPCGVIYCEVSAIYLSWQQAEDARRTKKNPEKYWVRRGRIVLPKT